VRDDYIDPGFSGGNVERPATIDGRHRGRQDRHRGGLQN
jgi:hypothetical protein